MNVRVTARVVIAVEVTLNDAESVEEAGDRISELLADDVFDDVLASRFADHRHRSSVGEVEITSATEVESDGLDG